MVDQRCGVGAEAEADGRGEVDLGVDVAARVGQRPAEHRVGQRDRPEARWRGGRPTLEVRLQLAPRWR